MRRILLGTLCRWAVSGWVPRRWVAGPAPVLPAPARKPEGEPLALELVSHCWKYSWPLTYQLSSLVLHPPRRLRVRMTVCYSPEDEGTQRLLEFIAGHQVPNVTWNWMPLPKERLFRRSIGRNRAALETKADWVWFTDCDQVFQEGCLDGLADILPGKSAPLVYPYRVRCTPLLAQDDPVFKALSGGPAVMALDSTDFRWVTHSRAVGALQIVRGEVARAVGYCRDIPFYQEPQDHWQKAYDDRAFRWFIGHQGEPIDLPGLCRIEHAGKGRKRIGRAAVPLAGE